MKDVTKRIDAMVLKKKSDREVALMLCSGIRQELYKQVLREHYRRLAKK